MARPKTLTEEEKIQKKEERIKNRIQFNPPSSFKEKFDNTNAWINGGYFVFSNKIFQYLKKNSDSLEKNVLEKILKYEKITVYKHKKFWHAMDTLRDKIYLNKLWYGKKVGWKTN